MSKSKQGTVSFNHRGWFGGGLLAAGLLLASAANASGINPLYSNPYGPDWVDASPGAWYIGTDPTSPRDYVSDLYSQPGQNSRNGRTSISMTFVNPDPIYLELHASGTYKIYASDGSFQILPGEWFEFKIQHGLPQAVENLRLTFAPMLGVIPAFDAFKAGGGGIIESVLNSVDGDTRQVDIAFNGNLFRGGDIVNVTSQALFANPEGWGWANNYANQDWAVLIELNPTGASSELPSNTVQETPIPGAIWLFGSGLLGLLGMRRKGDNA